MGERDFNLDTIGAGLVVARSRGELEAAATGGGGSGAMVVTAPPGTGKTTFVPPLISNLTWGGGGVRGGNGAGGVTILTQPRRVAVRAAASRLASLDGSAVGERVGFTVRGERHVSVGTRIEVVTPGVLLRRLLSDPGLDGVAAVVLDEVHERSVDSDLLLGMLTEVRSLRDDLTLVAMSATLDAGAVAGLLGASGGGSGLASSAPIVDIPSALHELAVDYAPFTGARLDERGVTRDYLAHLARVVATEHAVSGAGSNADALVFLPGVREVDEVVRLLRNDPQLSANTEVLALHGRIPAREQDRAVRGRLTTDEPRRIVVSTSLAESALTVPGVRLVVDAGLSREVRRDRSRDMEGLVTVSASRSSAEQRAGRAARQGPGRAVRVYSETDYARMLPEALPEIASADLLDAALLLAAWGAPGGRGLALLTPPPAEAMVRAEHMLASLGLVDATGRITAQGTRVSKLPLGVREARALLDGVAELGDAKLVSEIVAAFSDDVRAADADLSSLVRDLRAGRKPEAQRWRREQKRLEKIASSEARVIRVSGSGTPNSQRLAEATGIVTALARPEWIARRVSTSSRSYLLASGTRAALPEGSGLQSSEWIVVREAQRAAGRIADGTGAVIRLAAPITEVDALRIAAPLLERSREARIDAGRVKVRETRKLGAIVLADTPVAAHESDTGPAIAAHLRETGLKGLRWSETATSLRGRLALLHRELGAPWPDVRDEVLLATLDGWLGPDLRSLSPSASLSGIDVAGALRRLLPWPEAARFDEYAPERLQLPSGSTARIDYPSPNDDAGRPVVAAKLQELFGLATTPRIAQGRVAVLFHLLSPARKPLAITDDLESFWNGPYQDVRREMRGKYPRHPWPEDPWAAQATALTKRKLAQRGD